MSSENSSYPKANLTSLPISKPARFTGDTSENLQIDLGAAFAVDLVALVNHNLSSAATITVNGGSSANPNGSQFTTTISWRDRDAFKLLPTAQTWRYWKIIIADPANVDGFIELGFAMMGNATELGFNYRYGGMFVDEMVNLEVETEFGSPHVVELHERIRLLLPFRNVTAAQAIELQAIYRTTKRNLIPLFIIPDSGTNEGYFGRWVSHFERIDEEMAAPYKSLSLEFIQDGRGNRVAA